MPPLDSTAWAAIARRVAKGDRIADVARAYGVHPSAVRKRLAALETDPPSPVAKARKRKPAKAAGAKRESKPRKRPPPTHQVRRQLINRLYQAIDTKLKLMERRMHSEIEALEADKAEASEGVAALSAADHERETRAFGALVKTINSVRQLQAELDHIANTVTPTASAADARLAADADRYRRDIAQRLAKFVPPRS